MMKDKYKYAGLSTRSANCLKMADYETKEQVFLALEEGSFHKRNMPGLGEKSLKEIMAWAGFSGKTKDKRIYSAEQSIQNYMNSVLDRLISDQIAFGSITEISITIDDKCNKVSGVIIKTRK